MKHNILLNRSFDFAGQAILMFKVMRKNKVEYDLALQFLRCSTAVGALIREAQGAESRKDFIHKLAIAQKECEESIYWMELISIGYNLKIETEGMLNEANQLLKMLRSAILTLKAKLNETIPQTVKN